MTVHLRNIAKEIVSKFKKEGFNGVMFYEAYMQGSDTNDSMGELTDQEFDQRNRDYTIFVLSYDLEAFGSDDDDNDYVSTTYDYDSFEYDLTEYLQNKFGDDVSITYNQNTGEFECQRIEGYSAKEEHYESTELFYDGIRSKLIKQACKEIQNKDSITPALLEIADIKSIGSRMADDSLSPETRLEVEDYVKNLIVDIVSKYSIFRE